MTPTEFLEYKMSDEELNIFLNRTMNCRCYRETAPYFQTALKIIDEGCCDVDYKELIGYKDINIVKNVLFLKEKIDVNRGYIEGEFKVQRHIKKALSIQ